MGQWELTWDGFRESLRISRNQATTSEIIQDHLIHVTAGHFATHLRQKHRRTAVFQTGPGQKKINTCLNIIYIIYKFPCLGAELLLKLNQYKNSSR
jgi:hypothetical protein